MKKKLYCFFLILFIISVTIIFIPSVAMAASYNISSGGTYDIGSYGNGSTITINTSQPVTLKNQTGNTYTNMKIVCGQGVSLTINNVKINNSAIQNACAVSFSGSNNHLYLAGSSTLESSDLYAGIAVNSGASLEISGEGSIEVRGGGGAAGIGGNNNNSTGNVLISGGKVTAHSGADSAAIGGSYSHTGGVITISGGTVIADGGNAAIGGGCDGDGGIITISGGNVTATGNEGAGIGGGEFGSGGTISISGGTINATSEYSGAGIGGGGYGGKGGNITISGGHVTATGGDEAAGIGGSSGGDMGTITINDGTILANGGIDGPGIGGFGLYPEGSITIKGGNVTSIGGESGAGIGGGMEGCGGDINISGGIIIANGGHWASGIGGGANADGGVTTISAGNITATAGSQGAGIGGGSHGDAGDGGTVIISGGTIKAVAGYGGAGIGGGYHGSGVTFTITGGIIEAIGGDKDTLQGAGTGIGGGGGGAAGEITIEGGTVFAQKGEGALYDIGNGPGGSGGTLSISGDSAVFLKNNSSITPETTTHILMTADTITSHNAFGRMLPDSWNAPVYAYINSGEFARLIYDKNEGTGSVPETVVLYGGGSVTVAAGGNLTKGTDTFLYWNTKTDGTGDEYLPGNLLTLTGDKTLYAIYSVTVHVTSVTLSEDSVVMTDGETMALTAKVLPSDATHPAVTWSSSNEAVATVDQSGNVTAVYPGNALITAIADGDSATCSITVNPRHVTDITLNNDSETLETGNSITLTAAVLPAGSTYPEVTWTSGDETVAVVDQSGKVTALKTGNTIITATVDGISDTCDITVINKRFVVTFDLQGRGDPYSIKVDEGAYAPIPPIPVSPGYTFNGWYKEQACLNQWDFDNNVVTGDITLYVEWTRDGSPFSGSGTQANPYKIMSGADLASLAAFVNSADTSYNSSYYIQIRDIDLSSYSDWIPIGNSENAFNGTYEGNNKKIIGLNIISQADIYIGLFGNLGGTVRNVNIESGNININTSGNVYIGSIAGFITSGTVENCTNASDIKIINKSRNNTKYAGGIAGRACQNANLINCINYGNISVDGYTVYIGGTAGAVYYKTNITGCANQGCITAYGNKVEGGGILGISENTGDISNKSVLSKCYNSGNINITCAYAEVDSGGIVGQSASTDIIDCFNTGNLSADSTSHGESGGIAGSSRMEGYLLKNCYNLGSVSTYGRTGGIAGACYATTLDDYYYVNTCSKGIGVGDGTACSKTLTQMKQQSTYDGFDFDSVWIMYESGYCFPQIRGNLLYTQVHTVSLTADSGYGTLNGSGSHDFMDTVTIEAVPAQGYMLSEWTVVSGGVVLSSSKDASATFCMPLSDVSISAVFEKIRYTVTIQNDGSGTAAGSGSYAWGDAVSLSADADDGYQFMNWESDDITVEDDLDMTTSFTMPDFDVTIKAVFDDDAAGYSYTVSDGKATITEYSGSGGDVTVPYKIGGYRVITIGSGAFSGSAIKKVIIPFTVKTISANAFYACSALTSVTIGRGVESIGTGIFANCPNLSKIIVDSDNVSFKVVGDVLYDSSGSRLIAYPAGKIGPYTIPQGVESIDGYAFSGRYSSASISIPDSVISIGDYSFSYCPALSSLIMPDSVISIGDYAFFQCTGIEQLTISNSATIIGNHAFDQCTGLSEIIIPNSVTRIGDYAFYGCSNAESLILGNKVSSIGDYSFSGLEIRSADIPESVASLSESAFMGCGSLSSLYFWGERPGISYFIDHVSVYYHVKRASSWSSYTDAKAFCMLTKVLQNGQPTATGFVYLNSDMVPQILAPAWYDHTFEGWYIDSNCLNKWNAVPAAGDLTLYANWSPGPYTVTVVSANNSYGDVSGLGSYRADSSVTLHAMPEDGYRFTGWYKGETMVSDDPDFTFIPQGSSSYTAAFAKIDTPKIYQVSFTGGSTLQATWSHVTGVTGYEIWRSVLKDGPYSIIDKTNDTTYNDIKLNLNCTYYYKVTAYYSTDTKITRSAESDYASGKTAPAAPSIVSAVSSGYNSIRISWAEVPGAASYQIFRCTLKSGTYSFIYSSISTSYLDTNLKTGTCYYYKVCAYNAVPSDFSEAAFSVPVPAPVEGLRSEVSSINGVRVSWNKEKGSSGYEIWRSVSPDSGYEYIGTTKSTSYNNTGIIPNITYYYKVRSYSTAGKNIVPGDFSEFTASTPVLPAVHEVSASVSGPTVIKLSWGSIRGAKGYEVWRSVFPDSGFDCFTSTGSAKYTDSKLIPNITYYYSIKAYVIINGVRYYSSTDPDTVSATPILPVVTGLKAAASSATSVKITWNAVSGRNGYEVWRSVFPDSGFEYETSTGSTKYTDLKLIPNITYYYKIKAYVIINGLRYYSCADSEIVSAEPVLAAVTGLKPSAASATSVKLTWDAVSGKSGYEIWRLKPTDIDYTCVNSTTSTSYKDKGLDTGVSYYYKVRAYVLINGVRYYSDYSKEVYMTL